MVASLCLCPLRAAADPGLVLRCGPHAECESAPIIENRPRVFKLGEFEWDPEKHPPVTAAWGPPAGRLLKSVGPKLVSGARTVWRRLTTNRRKFDRETSQIESVWQEQARDPLGIWKGFGSRPTSAAGRRLESQAILRTQRTAGRLLLAALGGGTLFLVDALIDSDEETEDASPPNESVDRLEKD